MPKGDTLGLKEELFCELYAGDSPFFGNATRAYMAAYNIGTGREYSAGVMANRVLAKAKVRNKINQLLNKIITDETVDKELSKVIKQDDELAPKVAAIKEYNRVKKRVEEPSQNNVFVLSPERMAELKEVLNKNLNDKES